ncbi:2TM domain-containing protein [Paracidovorax sp. MALMAid1276]|uniref:2TM domain-containing protein n=1 Tax=Paracidovorax sp. MALMAid1276 TaxID=3411631 RepID=UPI003B9BB14F
MPSTTLPDPCARPSARHAADTNERLARRRAAAKLGWLTHATVYALVNTLLLTVSLAGGRGWALFPLLGWGLGLAVHGAVVFLATGGAGIYDRMLRAERERIARQPGAGR